VWQGRAGLAVAKECFRAFIYPSTLPAGPTAWLACLPMPEHRVQREMQTTSIDLEASKDAYARDVKTQVGGGRLGSGCRGVKTQEGVWAGPGSAGERASEWGAWPEGSSP